MTDTASFQAAVGYSQDHLTIADRGTGRSDRGTLGAQVRERIGPISVTALVSAAYKSSDSDRTITYASVNELASAEFNTWVVSSDVRLEYEAVNAMGWYVTPYAGLSIDKVTTDGFSELFANGLGLRVDGFGTTQSSVFVGGSVKRAYPLQAGGILVPEVSLEYTGYLDGYDRSIGGRLEGAGASGATLEVSGRGPERRLETGVWLNLQSNPVLSIKGGFLASFLDGTETFGGALRIDFRFN
jgi:uncharacterized protein with beta-barrel porin domain